MFISRNILCTIMLSLYYHYQCKTMACCPFNVYSYTITKLYHAFLMLLFCPLTYIKINSSSTTFIRMIRKVTVTTKVTQKQQHPFFLHNNFCWCIVYFNVKSTYNECFEEERGVSLCQVLHQL